ncbi:MAG: hypothetical protein EOO51_09295 [Flavobacterium sp.]|nr:MAG: hypothetical protein EOO51_09295 [Flavobacterium sp.]
MKAKKKNIIVGIAAGAALLSVALLLAKRRGFSLSSMYSSAEDLVDNMKGRISGTNSSSDSESDHGGNRLANKARHKAEHHLAMSKNGHH